MKRLDEKSMVYPIASPVTVEHLGVFSTWQTTRLMQYGCDLQLSHFKLTQRASFYPKQ